MRGKVKYTRRNTWYTESQQYHWSSDVHPERHTCSYAVPYNGDTVYIDEDDIRSYYNRRKINDNLVDNILSNDLHNVYIEYYEDDEGDYCLDGKLNDYI